MIELPSTIWSLYRVATDGEIRNWSYGALTAVRTPAPKMWTATRGTLGDQRIFGPVKDFDCACGKYRGIKFQGMICDRCGVKVTTRGVRRTRFGHVELAAAVPHPVGGPSDSLAAFPVLPAAYFESLEGRRLADLYDDLMRASTGQGFRKVEEVIREICEYVAPILIQAHRWNLQDEPILAHGVALIEKGRSPWDDSRCENCGYPLEGLAVAACPECGGSVRGAP